MKKWVMRPLKSLVSASSPSIGTRNRHLIIIKIDDFLSHGVSEGEEDEENGVNLHDDNNDDEFDAEEIARQIETRHNAQLDKERGQGRAASNEAEGVLPVIFYVTVAVRGFLLPCILLKLT